jgi:hypothetical protein
MVLLAGLLCIHALAEELDEGKPKKYQKPAALSNPYNYSSTNKEEKSISNPYDNHDFWDESHKHDIFSGPYDFNTMNETEKATIFSGPYDYHTWNDTDRTLLRLSTIALIMDWRQTHESIVKTGRDLNPILDRQSPDFIDAYFLCAIVGNVILAQNLSPEYRRSWLVFITIAEAYIVGANFNNGYSVSF